MALHFSLTVPAGSERGAVYMDQALAALHHGNPHRLPLSFRFARIGGTVALVVSCPPPLKALLRSQLYAQYPDCRLLELADEALAPPSGMTTWTASLTLSHDVFPCKRYPQFEDSQNSRSADPLTAVLSTLLPERKAPLVAGIEVTVRPCRERRCRRLRRVLPRLAGMEAPRLARFYAAHASSLAPTDRILAFLTRLIARRSEHTAHSRLDISSPRTHDREDDLQAAADKAGRNLFEATMRLTVSARLEHQAEARRKLAEMAGAFGQFRNREAVFHRAHGRKARRPFLLSTEELSTLWHPPSQTVRAETLDTVAYREFEPPVNLPTPAKQRDLATLGVAVFRGKRQLCGLLPDDRRRHVVIEGRTGMGKSSLLLNLVLSDIAAGRGTALVDPHGDLLNAVLAATPPQRSNDTILFDAGDSEHPIAFNIFDCPLSEQRPLVASAIVGTFKRLYAEFFGPRMEHFFRNAVLALLETPGSTLLSVLRFLGDAPYRASVLQGVSDPIVRSVWLREFAGMPAKLQAEAIAPIQNKVGAFASSPLLRNIIGQPRSTLNLRSVMDEGKVLLVNLSKGRVGDDASALLGSFLVTALQLAAMGRAELPEEQRRDFYLHVDEFQSYCGTESFATILSEARKYRLNMTLAHQYLAQVAESTLHAVFGNVGTLIAFSVGAEDAEIVARQLGGQLSPTDVLSLPAYHAYTRLLIRGSPSKPFVLQTLPPAQRRVDPRRAEAVRRASRERYARPKARVERGIAAAFAHSVPPARAVSRRAEAFA